MVLTPLSFTNISGGAARHEKVSPKTWRILAFADAIWFLSLQVFTTDQPRSRAFKKTFAPLAFAKKFYVLVVFREKIKDKIAFFSLVNARICENNVEMFLLAGKTLETFNFISFYLLSLHFDSQSLQKCVKNFCQILMQSLFIYCVYPYKQFCLQHQVLTFTLIELFFMLFI